MATLGYVATVRLPWVSPSASAHGAESWHVVRKTTLQMHALSSVFPPVKMAAPPPESSGSNEDVETGPVRLTGFVASAFYFWRPDSLVDDEERKPIAKEVQASTLIVRL
jgi:hypothetical protein